MKKTPALLPLVAVLLAVACDERKPAPPTTARLDLARPSARRDLAPPPPGPDMTPAMPTARGKVAGVVAFTGSAPEMPVLRRDTDPFCNRTRMTSEEVLVNGNATLRNVLVRLVDVPWVFPPPPGAVRLDQVNCMFRPRVQGVVAGQTVRVTNSDPTLHNVHTYRGVGTLFNLAQIAGGPGIERKLTDGGGVIRFKCDVHPWMLAHVHVMNHPFFAVTGEDGSFALPDVPEGRYRIEAWHERYGTKSQEIVVSAAAPVEVRFSYDGTETGRP